MIKDANDLLDRRIRERTEKICLRWTPTEMVKTMNSWEISPQKKMWLIRSAFVYRNPKAISEMMLRLDIWPTTLDEKLGLRHLGSETYGSLLKQTMID